MCNNDKMRVLGTYNSHSKNMKERRIVWPMEVPSRQSFGGKDQLKFRNTKLRGINIQIQSDLFAVAYQFHHLLAEYSKIPEIISHNGKHDNY